MFYLEYFHDALALSEKQTEIIEKKSLFTDHFLQLQKYFLQKFSTCVTCNKKKKQHPGLEWH